MIKYPNRVISIDCETTGLVPNYDCITSFDAWEFKDGEPTGEHLSLKIQPSIRTKLSLEAFAVQGGEGCFSVEGIARTLERLFAPDAISQIEAMARIELWCKGIGAFHIPNVAQRASFDWSFFDEQLGRYAKGFSFCPLWICTKAMSRAAFPHLEKAASLGQIASLLEIEHDKTMQHDSCYDALLCGRVYFGLKKLLEGAP